MDDEALPDDQLIALRDRHRWRKKQSRPLPLRGGRFIPAELARVHEGPEGVWFEVVTRRAFPGELSA